ncbi:hypothetical protein L1281_001071 [Neisseria sp. HSC-16F19]|nr:DUF2493 domain-containing protein [Neisseria sp. HSC-16F19]MCP2040488.1 hypothetical protein [Neisseria sp. HSC-16F19]
MKLAIVGGRDFDDYALLYRHLADIAGVTEIVSGGAVGADALAERYAAERGLPLTVFKPDWSQGRRAGPLRNSQIVDYCDALLACWDGKSKGTRDSIRKAEAQGKLLAVVAYGYHG